MNKYNINDLGKLVKQAREKSLKGVYLDSFELYKSCLDLISQRVKESTDQNIREQWFKTGQNLKQELIEVKEILDCCYTFKMEKKENQDKNNVILRDYLDFGGNLNNNNNNNNRKSYKQDNYKFMEFPNDKYSNKQPRMHSNEDGRNNAPEDANQNIESENEKKRFEHFGGKVPFQHHNKDRDYSDDKNDKDNHNLNLNKNAYSNNHNLRKNYSNNIVKKPINVDENKRKYEKPWKANESNDKDKKKDKNGKTEGKSDGKSAFYKHHYPDGEGPDGYLIETLEGEVVDKNPSVKFEDIAELDNAKGILNESVLLPILMPDYFTGIRRPWRGVLLYGPPGTGKTMLAKALATQGKTVFFNVSASTFASKWRGESEKLIRLLFEMAKFYAPSVIFIDEVDSIGSRRSDGEGDANRRSKAELLVQMDGANSSSSAGANKEDKENKIVMVLGATNRPWDLDEALRRRFEKRVYIPLPNEIGRKEMFKINLQGVSLEENINWDVIIKNTAGYSGADIANVCREASLMQMRRRLLGGQSDIMKLVNNPNFEKELDAPISENDLLESLKNISKSVSQEDIKEYDEWTNKFKSN